MKTKKVNEKRDYLVLILRQRQLVLTDIVIIARLVFVCLHLDLSFSVRIVKRRISRNLNAMLLYFNWKLLRILVDCDVNLLVFDCGPSP